MTRGSDLRRVLREGKRARTEYLEVRILASLLRSPRVGIIVPKYRHTAVERNRIKRHLREIVRLRVLPELRTGVDVVIRAGPRSYEAGFDVLLSDVVRGMERVGLPGTGS